MITIQAGPFLDTLREHLKVGLADHTDCADWILATFDRAALRAIVEAHEPKAPELTPQQRGGLTRKANRLKREREQTKAALANGNANNADNDSTLAFPGSPTGGA